MQWTTIRIAVRRPIPAPLLDAAWIMLAAERTRAVLFIPVAMGAGAATYFGLLHEPPLWPMLLAAFGFAVIAASIRRRVAARITAVAGLAFAVGLLAPALQTRRALPMMALPRHAVVIEGEIAATDTLPGGATRVTIAHPTLDGGSPAQRTIRVRLRTADAGHPADGDVVRVRALLRPPSPPAYPGAWDLQRDAYFSGLAGSGFALGPVTEIGPRVAADGPAAWWRRLRDGIADRLEAGLPGPRGAIAATLMAGRATAIPPADRAAFTDSGLAHLLAVAGLHIGIVMGLALGVVRGGLACWPYAALRWPLRQIAAVAALFAGGLYLGLTGAHLPIVRSFCMACLATTGIMLGRRALSMRALAVAAVAILAVWPNEITGVSFQMSFAAVAALIAGYEALRPIFARLANGGHGRRLMLHIAALATTSVLAGTASAPFAAYHFGQIQLYFVLANLLAVPITASWIMPLGIAALALIPFGAEHVALVPMGWGIGIVLWLARSVSALPSATLDVPPIPMVGLLVASAGLALLCLLGSRLRLAGIVLIVAGLGSPLFELPPDLLVSDDARLIGVRADGRMMIAKRAGASKFTLQAFERAWAEDREPLLLPAATGVGSLRCSPTTCGLSGHGHALVLSLDEKAPIDCAGADLVVAAFPLREACDGVPRIDRFSVWRDGAYAVWLGGRGVTVVSDRQWRGDRPWVPPPPQPRRPKPSAPMAASE
jgi:competence protein ComEC